MARHDWTALDGISDRLRHSRNPAERRAICVGQSYHHKYPVLLDSNLLFEHMHILGPTGSGKTSLGLQTDLIQLIRRGDGAVVIFDCKGDPGFFHTVRLEAQRAGRTFKWFTNKPYRSTYVFNPWDQQLLQRLTLPEILGLITQSLNLHHGDDYGRAWFSINARILLKRAIQETMPDSAKHSILAKGGQMRLFPKHGPIQSFRDLHVILRDLSHDSDEFKAAQHLAFIVESLADFDQLNLAPNRDQNHPAITHAIHMPEVIRQKQVVYFYLVGAMDLASVAELARLGLFCLLSATNAYRDEHGYPPRVYSVWDEAQVMIAKNIENVLAQARSYGLSCILSHQTMSQLNPPGGVDLRELVMSCTAVKQVFAARDPWLQNYIINTSGQAKYYKPSYTLSLEQYLQGSIAERYAIRKRQEELRRVDITEYSAPRLNGEDIKNVSRHPNLSLLSIDRVLGLSNLHGWCPIYTDWPMSQRVHQKRQYETRWPPASEATLDIVSDWPDENQHTIASTSHPSVAVTEEALSVSDKLRTIKRKLEQK